MATGAAKGSWARASTHVPLGPGLGPGLGPAHGALDLGRDPLAAPVAMYFHKKGMEI